MRSPLLKFTRATALAGLLFATLTLGVTLVTPALAQDDRDLFSAGSETPYLFVLFDTSGSMHWKPPCTDPDGCSYECPLDNDLCAKICPRHTCTDNQTGVVIEKPVCSLGETEGWLCETGNCPQGDCYAPLNGDDPGSKFFQAKSAIYQVIQETLDEKIPLHLGFATFNQDNLSMRGSHWLYNLAPGQTLVTLDSGLKFPNPLIPQVFGRIWNCRAGPDTGFEQQEPATLGQPWQELRLYRCPQLGQDGNQDSVDTVNMLYFVDPADGNRYRVEFEDTGSNKPGDETLRANLHVDRCDNADCSSTTRVGTKDLNYNLISEFTAWDFQGVDNNNLLAPRLGFFPQGTVRDGPANNTCTGWDPNSDTAADTTGGINLRFPTEPTDPLGADLTVGDIIPLDWRFDHKEELLRRLAPNRSPGGAPDSPPDFRIATYFQDVPGAAGANLNLLETNERPITAQGGTPLAGSVNNFRNWFDSWKGKAQNSVTGDETFGCKNVYLLVITDGDETCGGDPCLATQTLYGGDPDNPLAQTYVIGFGLPGGAGNTLSCMPKYLVDDVAGSDPDGKCLDDTTGASLLNGNGVCQKPFFANDQEELIDIIKSVVRDVTGKTRAFATAAVPSVQATVSDKIFLSNFVPVADESVWDGHVNAFLKPLPLVDGKPDTSDPNFLWDAGEVVATTQVPGGDKLGGASNQRRVYYSLFPQTTNTPRVRRLLEPTTSTLPILTRRDLWFGMEIGFSPGNIPSEAAAELEANQSIDELFTLKEYNNPDLGLVSYVIGDVFHSNPVLIGTPPNTLYFTLNLMDNGLACDEDSSGEPLNPGYRCFTLKHENRRKVLFVGTNEGILHGFDAGLYDEATGEFDNGTGKEMFGFVPRTILPKINDARLSNNHEFTVDGSFIVDDVFIDPAHLGTPDEDDREWRTVGIGGLRRGGSGYYALDITSPDPVRKVTDAEGLPLWIPEPRADRLPRCWGNENGLGQPAKCGESAYPSVLWEFEDKIQLSQFIDVNLDEEPSTTTFITVNGRSEKVVGKSEFDLGGNLIEAFPDLGETWSDPVIGRIAICGAPGTNCDPNATGNTVVDRFVAIFGGGYDPDQEHQRGNWIYMVDIESGETLYKRMVLGSVPGQLATLDVNGDGYLDRLYAGTTRGFLYRIDLERDFSGDWPALVDTTVDDIDGTQHDVERVDPTFWIPRVVFDANETNLGSLDTLVRGRAVFLRPEIAFVPEFNSFAVVFGTGYRDVLWSQFRASEGGAQRGRLFVFIDDTDETDPVLDQDDLTRITPTSGAATAPNLLASGGGGWYMDLEPNERLISVPFIVSGVLIFNTYTPDPQSVTTIGGLCRREGSSRIYGVFLTNGNGLLSTSANDPTPDRFEQIDDFVTAPFTEPGQTKNPTDDGSGEPEPTVLSEAQAAILEQLKEFMPPYCRYASYTMDVKVSRSDTGIKFIAPIPICLVEKNWREF